MGVLPTFAVGEVDVEQPPLQFLQGLGTIADDVHVHKVDIGLDVRSADIIKHPADALESARTDSEREFAEALGDLMSGHIEIAEERFAKLRQSASDSIIFLPSFPAANASASPSPGVSRTRLRSFLRMSQQEISTAKTPSTFSISSAIFTANGR